MNKSRNLISNNKNNLLFLSNTAPFEEFIDFYNEKNNNKYPLSENLLGPGTEHIPEKNREDVSRLVEAINGIDDRDSLKEIAIAAFSKLVEEEIEIDSALLSVSRRVSAAMIKNRRKQMSEEEKAEMRIKDAVRMRKRRAAMSQEEKAKARALDAERKRRKRQELKLS